MVRLSTLFLLPVASDVFLPPQEIMKVFRYSCNSENPCKSGTAPVTCLAHSMISSMNPFNTKGRNEEDEEEHAGEE